MSKLFYKTVQADPKTEKTPINWRKAIRRGVLALLLVAVLVLVIMQGKGFFDKVYASWDEMMFAYQKPHLVETIREDYEEKHKKLEQSFLKKEKSSEEKLVDEVVKRLQAADNLK